MLNLQSKGVGCDIVKKEQAHTFTDIHLLDIVVCIGVSRSVESVKFIIDEANVSDV